VLQVSAFQSETHSLRGWFLSWSDLPAWFMMSFIVISSLRVSLVKNEVMGLDFEVESTRRHLFTNVKLLKINIFILKYIYILKLLIYIYIYIKASQFDVADTDMANVVYILCFMTIIDSVL
jgi:hypothetical protein